MKAARKKIKKKKKIIRKNDKQKLLYLQSVKESNYVIIGIGYNVYIFETALCEFCQKKYVTGFH